MTGDGAPNGARRDPFGLAPLYLAGERHGASVRGLLGADRALDRIAVAAHLAGGVDPARTCFAAVRPVPPGHEVQRGVLRPWHVVAGGVAGAPSGAAPSLAAALRGAIARIVEAAPRPLAVALSGGLDSAVVLALVRELEPDVPALVLAPRIVGYSELAAARDTARALGASVRVLDVTAEDIIAATPAAIGAFEAPLYNLHPVSKWLLATRARDAGFASVVSGDGADQVFTRDLSADYLPLVGAAFAATGVALHAPFLADEVVAAILAGPADREKQALRALGRTLPVPAALVRDRKVGQLAPPLPLGVPARKLADLGAKLGGAPAPDVRWETLALLVDSFEAWA